MTSFDLLAILPLAVLAGWACLLLLVDLFIPAGRKAWTAGLAVLGLLIVLGLVLAQPLYTAGQPPTSLSGFYILDGFSMLLDALVAIAGLIGIALAFDYLRRMGIEHGEYYVLLLFTILGTMLMAGANDLIVVFLALELLSIPLYILSGFAHPRPDSEEAALKYFLLGAFSTGFVVYGIALVFGATGTTSLPNLVSFFTSPNTLISLRAMLLIGAGLILIGLGFKVAAVPFHMWTPDVYQGAPSAIVAYMAFGAKAGGFAALLRVFITAFPGLSADVWPVIWGLAALTMILGNIIALAQNNIKRLLAYSSISHAGYILMALVPFGQQKIAPDAIAAVLFYLLAYAITNFAAWSVVIAVEKAEGQGLMIQDYAGLASKYPGLAAVMAIAMFSFTGVPPTVGFLGKFYLFRVALEGGYVWLAIIGVLTSLISAYYYLRVVVVMYMQEGNPVARSETWLNLIAGVSGLVTLLLIVVSEPLFTWITQAVMK